MRKVFLDELPRWEKGEGAGKPGSINWSKCIGYKIPFVYDDIEGEIKIINYEKESQRLYILYDDKESYMRSSDILKVKFKCLLGLKTKEFRFEIGKIIHDGNSKITNRKYLKNERGQNCKYYEYKCNICGYIGLVAEHHVLDRSCGCCSNRIVVPEINSIYAKEPLMMRWISEEDAKKYISGSSEKIKMTCPDCGKEKNKEIRILYRDKSLGCTCGDGYSYPEKLMYSILEQLNVEFETQLSKVNFEWCDKYKYDFYIPSLNMIIETHGMQHYEQVKGFYKTLEEEQENDRVKKRLALSNGVEYYIELDCRYSDLDYIKDSTANSELVNIFDLSKVDWNKCEEFAIKNNKVKEVCEYWNQKEEWETTADLERVFNCRKSKIIDYLKKGTKLKWCDYDPKKEMKKSAIKNGVSNGMRTVALKDNVIIAESYSAAELGRIMTEMLKEYMCGKSISAVAKGKRDSYKGYNFKYVN